MGIHHNRMFMFCVNLDNGTLIGNFYDSISTYSSLETPIISQYGDSSILVYYKHQSGYIAFELNLETGTFVNRYRSTAGASSVNSISPIFDNGFALFSMNAGVADMTIFRFYYHDPQIREVLLDGSVGIATEDDYEYSRSSGTSLFSTYTGNITVIDGSDSAQYTSFYNEVGRIVNDLIYLQGYSQTFYAPHNSTSIVDYTYFCSQSGSTTIGSVVYHPETNQISTWVTLTGDNQHLTVNAPAISTETEEIQLGIYYLTNVTNPINSRPILILYQCNIANCGS